MIGCQNISVIIVKVSVSQQRFGDFPTITGKRFGDFPTIMGKRFGDFPTFSGKRFGDFPTFSGKRFGDFRFPLYFCTFQEIIWEIHIFIVILRYDGSIVIYHSRM